MFRWLPRIAARWLALDDRELGALGESVAARALARSGLRILGRRVQSRNIEVDLVALDGETLVCVEVKTARGRAPARLDPLRRPGRRADAARAARQRRAARELSRTLASGRVRAVRVDLVEVWIDPTALSVIHHPRWSEGFS